MKKEAEIIIHIGLHKTGTSFLQKQLYPLYNSIQTVKGTHQLRSFWDNNKNNKLLLISDEYISGRLFSGSYLDDFLNNIETIKEIFGNAKIIVGFRKHSSFLVSVYKEFINEGGFYDFNHLFNFNDTGLIKSDELFFKQRLDILRNNFEQVFVYSQEDLRNRLDDFVNSFSKFIGTNELIDKEKLSALKNKNVGIIGSFQLETLRKINKINDFTNRKLHFPNMYSRFFKRIRITPRDFMQNYLKFVPSKPFKINKNIIDQISEFYFEDWELVKNEVSF